MRVRRVHVTRRGDRRPTFGVATVPLAQTALPYPAPLQAMFGNAPLSCTDPMIATLVGLPIVPVVAPEQWLLRRMD